MLEHCYLCGTKRAAGAVGLHEKGDWYCDQHCRHGGRGLNAIDELIDLLRDAFCDRPEIMKRIRESVIRSLDAF